MYSRILSSWVGEETRSINDRCIVSGAAVELETSGESADGVRKSIDGISVVEWLSTECCVKNFTSDERVTVADIYIRLDNPDKLFAWVVEVKLNLVTGRSDGLITSELKLLNKVLVWVLCHASALIGIEENVVNIERSGNKRLRVSLCSFVAGTRSEVSINLGNSEKAFVHGAKLEVDLDLVILKSNKRKSKTWVAAEPELKWNVKCGLRKSLARSADCLRNIGG